MTETVFVHKARYDYTRLQPTVFDMLDAVGTLKIRSGCRPD